MIYLIDASVFITAHQLYYPIDRVPEFWDWLIHHAENGVVKVPIEIFEEVREGPDSEARDLLFDFISDPVVKRIFILDEEVDPVIVDRVVSEGYAADLTDSELEQVGRDPFLVAHALTDRAHRAVVTTEVSKPKKLRQNRKLPDVCAQFGVRAIDTFALARELNFSTSWR